MNKVESLDLWQNQDEATPLKPDLWWALKMLSITLWAIAGCFVIFWWFSYALISFISLEDEEKYFWNIFVDDNTELLDFSRLEYSLPEWKDYEVYIMEEDTENAFAAIWARLFVTRWLLENVATEEELLFIIGHEISHLENRDALRSFLINAPLTLTMSLLWMDVWIPMQQISSLFINQNSREVERTADTWWVALLQELWLNTECAVWFFERNGTENEKYFEMFSTHPVSSERVEFIKNSAWELSGKECTEFTY